MPLGFPGAPLRLLAAGVALVLGLSGCAPNDALAEQANAGDNKNYIAGDGSVTEYAPESRGEPVQLTGTFYDGTVVDSADFKGQVTVLNIWYAACAPCRVEAPDLQALYEKHQQSGVQFIGVNIRDEAATAAAFERTFGITYPSIDDADGAVLLAMTQYVPPQAVPSTLVLDRQGRVAGRIIGLAEKSTLNALITDAIAEP
ncbi:TlpA disulfide reductase family protein [Arthrobacter sp. 35/47]|uniref:TlpA family protein disulfide reductase n=1 Tax=Arthrobacter sp. 35/47 TaxID=269454 RepID=UPI0004799F67|nr:TlpA disulfide reductase family protein [Arthrobacter sp. 35/47]